MITYGVVTLWSEEPGRRIMSLNVLFISAAVICAVLFLLSFKARHKNYGFSLTAFLLILCNVVSVFLIENRPIKEARVLFFVFYIAYSCMFFGVSWSILKMSAVKVSRRWMIIMGCVSAVLTGFVVALFNVPHSISFSKRILYGKNWWITESAPGNSGFVSFGTYGNMCIIASLMIMVLAVYCFLTTEKMFRGKFIYLMVFQVFFTALTVLIFIYRLPFWISILIMNIVCFFTYYFAFLQADRRLRDVAIMSFANEMSDGFILYNSYNDLIHVNDLVKNNMDSGFLREIRDRNWLEEWTTHVETIETIETVPYRKDDREVYFKITKHSLGSGNRPAGTAYILHDTTNSITQIRLMEQVNTELERTARMKSDFLANMSHELRTPMNAVIGMAQIARREEGLSARVKDCLDQIDHSGKNLLNIINDILDYSKIDAGKMEIIEDRYEPLSEVNDVSHILQTRVGDKGLELFYLVDPALPHELIGDSMRIRQILINLANNAVKFTEHGVVKITLDCEKTGDDEVMLTYHVIDTGQGIREEDLQKLFVSFQQVDSKRNRNVEGTGLGLAISKSLCEAMGGSIGVSSEYGKGSDFWFCVPQKVSVPDCDLVIRDADEKFVYVLNERNEMEEQFHKEMARLGLKSRGIAALEMYEPTGKKDFLFIEESFFTKNVEKLMADNPELTVVVLTPMGSDFRAPSRHVRVMSRPMSTLAMVLILNGSELSSVISGIEDKKQVSFMAPDAKVLIIDDNSINLSIATGLMEPLKIKCVTALSGMEAIEKLKEESFDIILMDHMMPGMDGIETTKVIRRDIRSADDTPIVALTANVVEGSREMFIGAGMVDVIPKPVEAAFLNRKLYELLPKDKIIESHDIPDQGSGDEEEIHGIYDCLDCEKAIEVLGSEALFNKIVEEYYRRGEKTLEEIETDYDTANWADYAIKTHSLKSSSRQIGAPELGDLAYKLELAGKAENVDEINSYHAKAMETFRKLLDDLSKYFEEEEKEELESVSEEELRSIFAALSDACENLDMDSMEDCAGKLKKYSYPPDKKEIIDKICLAVENMDTDECINAIADYAV